MNWYVTVPTTPHLSLMEVSAGIEYWVNANRHTKWASYVKGGSHPLSLANRVGQPFTDLVGDPEAWAESLRTSYSALKHDLQFSGDPWVIGDLAMAGCYLLGAACSSPVGLNLRP